MRLSVYIHSVCMGLYYFSYFPFGLRSMGRTLVCSWVFKENRISIRRLGYLDTSGCCMWPVTFSLPGWMLGHSLFVPWLRNSETIGATRFSENLGFAKRRYTKSRSFPPDFFLFLTLHGANMKVKHLSRSFSHNPKTPPRRCGATHVSSSSSLWREQSDHLNHSQVLGALILISELSTGIPLFSKRHLLLRPLCEKTQTLSSLSLKLCGEGSHLVLHRQS